MMKVGLCSRIARCLEQVPPTWAGHGEVTLESFSTTPIFQILLCLKAGMLGISKAVSKISHS